MAKSKNKSNVGGVGENKVSGRSKGLKRTEVKRGQKRGDAWQQMGEMSYADTPEYRDVHRSQQLSRGVPGEVKTYAMPNLIAAGIGVATAFLAWIVWGVGGYFVAWASSSFGSSNDGLDQARELGVPDYFVPQERPMGEGTSLTETCYAPTGPDGGLLPGGDCYGSVGSVPVPEWHTDMTHQAMTNAGIPVETGGNTDTLGSWLLFDHVGVGRLLFVFGIAALVGYLSSVLLRKQRDAYNQMYDTSDINNHQGDQKIALPEEVAQKYSPFPNVGARCPTAPSSLISHINLSDKGVTDVQLTQFADDDVVDEKTGDTIYLKNEPLRDDDGKIVTKTVPMIDEEFGDALWDGSGLPKIKALRRRFDARKLSYNPGGKDIVKASKQDTLAEFINEEWEFPEYEPQRPSGVYIVDEAPVNTMVLAMTRAGKGQTYIEPMIDMWLRETRGNNMVINDPKGELLVKNYVRASKRGYQVVQFNLINALKTDIYNPLAMAADAAREGDSTKTAMYVENIAEVFFPIEGSGDPVWPSAANNAFKRTAYGMIDFYLEEEREMRKQAKVTHVEPKVLETRIDQMWGKVTLYNCYQFFVQLSAKKLKDPITLVNERAEAMEFGDVEGDSTAQMAYQQEIDKAEPRMPIWNGEAELDMLTLFFNATDLLPKNTMRDLVGNADKSLRAMGAAEKMLASVYGIAITAMSFFTDPTISTLTSGTLSQNVDFAGLSFPRRFGVRFDQNYVSREKLVGTKVVWDAFEDRKFTRQLPDKLFRHDDTIGREGWARYYFDGKFPKNTAYVRLRIFTNGSDMLMKTFYFKFTKGYQTNLRGQSYIKDPVNGTKIVKDGILTELQMQDDGSLIEEDSVFTEKRMNISQLSVDDISTDQRAKDNVKLIDDHRPVIIMPQVRYSEQPKAVFLVTPPHLMKYAKLILILIKQLVDLNFDKSYMTKANQKPLYKTRFMLDELGKSDCETLLTCNV